METRAGHRPPNKPIPAKVHGTTGRRRQRRKRHDRPTGSGTVDLLGHSKEPTTYYSDYRGLLTTRTSWKADAAFLFFEPRNVPGGHTWDSRNDFIIASHGRCWNYRPSGTEGSSDQRSVILIDGEGQGHQCVQGRVLSLDDEARVTRVRPPRGEW